MAGMLKVVALTLFLGASALESNAAHLRGAAEMQMKQEPVSTNSTSVETVAAPYDSYTMPGNRTKPTEQKRLIVMVALPLLAIAFLLVHVGDKRSCPKWFGMIGCIVGLYAAHVSYGVLQEYIMTAPYTLQTSRGESSRPFPSVSFLVFMNRLVATIFAALVVRFVQKKPLGIMGGVDAEGSVRIACLLPSLTNVAATWFQYGSLWYITFPTQMVFKSMKLVPVLICSQCFLKKETPLREWMDAFIITAGVVAFAFFAETDSTAGSVPLTSHAVGALMLLGFLLCDAVTPSLQKRAFSNANLDAFQMMFWIGAASSIYAGAMLFAGGEVNAIMQFLTDRPEALIDVALLSTIATLGQIFIYITVQKHGPVTLSMIMTTRQVWSVLLSCVLFGHRLPGVAVGAASMVFSVLLVRSYRSVQQPGDISRRSKADTSKLDNGSDYAAAANPSSEAGSGAPSQISAAFGVGRGFVSRFSSRAGALSGKLRG